MQGLAAASVAAVVLVMLAPLRPGSSMQGPRREASLIPMLSANGLAQSGAFHRLEFKPVICASSEPQFLKPGSREAGGRRLRVVTVRKRVLPLEVDLEAPRRAWDSLSKGLRETIDASSGSGRSASAVVIHGSGGLDTSEVSGLRRMHRMVFRSAPGVAYDFIISDDDGESRIQVGDRWATGSQASGDIRVCLAGDFRNDGPSPAQLESLHELVDYLRVRLGHVSVTTHAREAGRAVSCMGDAFPEDAVLNALNSSE